jgi:hypothetical protein
MIVLARHPPDSEYCLPPHGISVYMRLGAVHFRLNKDLGEECSEVSVTPAAAKRFLEDALEALTKWSLEN